jgi:hypothetical protein
MTEYQFSLKIRDKEIKFRKWKVKDKKKFIETVKTGDSELSNGIVFDSIEDKNIILTENELKYLLINIRNVSLGDKLSYEIECSNCFKDYFYEADILDIMTPNFESFGTLKALDTTIEMAEISNKEYYEDAINQCTSDGERYFIDFLYHIKKLNGSDTFTFDSLYDYINNLDIDIGEDIFKQWEKMRFTFDNIKDIQCAHCEHVESIQFDELYGFFPQAWFQ